MSLRVVTVTCKNLFPFVSTSWCNYSNSLNQTHIEELKQKYIKKWGTLNDYISLLGQATKVSECSDQFLSTSYEEDCFMVNVASKRNRKDLIRHLWVQKESKPVVVYTSKSLDGVVVQVFNKPSEEIKG